MKLSMNESNKIKLDVQIQLLFQLRKMNEENKRDKVAKLC